MPETKDRGAARLFSPARAVLLCRGESSPQDRNLTQLLDFFEVPWKSVTIRNADVDDREGRYAVVSSAACLAEAMNEANGTGAALPSWVRKASTVYVHGFHDDDPSTKVLRVLTGDRQAKVRPVQPGVTTMTVAEDFPEMCGPMSGMRVRATMREPGCVCAGVPGGEAFQSVLRTDQGELFFGVRYGGVRFYLNMWSRTIDIAALAPSFFDVRSSFCEAVPPALFLTWAFRDTVPGRAETNACLIVDDPPLKRRYGFLDFREALGLMDRHNFTTTIAFIPWNWRRSDAHTVSMFQSRPEKLSLVVHGCDHTASEFAVRSPALLNEKIRTSIQRMEFLERRAAIEVDRVMVFPQGVFSPETGRTLKLNGFIAAVNTEVAPSDRESNETTIADLWNMAIMRYGTFPIFTRRYAEHGIENFAFDALLGKPCLIASHHEVFKDHARNLMDFIARLNALQWNLLWRPLGEVVRRSVGVRRLEDGTSVLRMFAGSSVLENTDSEAHRTLLLKEEGDPDCVEAVWVNGSSAEFSVEGGFLRVWMTLLPRESAVVRILYRNTLEAIANRRSSRDRIKIAANRYLSEFRDNYLSRSDFLYRGANRLKHFVK